VCVCQQGGGVGWGSELTLRFRPLPASRAELSDFRPSFLGFDLQIPDFWARVIPDFRFHILDFRFQISESMGYLAALQSICQSGPFPGFPVKIDILLHKWTP